MSLVTLPDRANGSEPGEQAAPSSPSARRRQRWTAAAVVGAICALGLAARLHEIGTQSLWLDEAISSSFADQGLRALWSWTHPLDAYHPPGYYSLLAIWQFLGGHSEAWIRSLSALAGVAAIPLTYAATNRIAGRWPGYLAAALLAVSAQQVRFGQETRTYALLVLEAALVLWSLTWLLRYPRMAAAPLKGNPAALRWYAYVGGMSMAHLSHNTSPLLWGTALVAVLVHWYLTPNRSSAFLWAWAKANLAVAAIWMSWFPVFVRQSLQTLEGGTHREVPDVADLVLAFRELTLGQSRLAEGWMRAGDVIAIVAVLAGVGALVLVGRHRPHVGRWLLTLLLFTFAAPVGAYVMSVLGKPVFLTQSLMWVMVPFFMLVGVVVAQIPRVLGMPAAAAALAISVLGLVAYYPNVQKEPWRDVATYLRPQLQPGDLIVYNADYVMVPLQYYLHQPPGVTQIGTRYQPPDLASVRRELPDARTVWLVYAHEEFADPNRWVAQVLDERGDVDEQRQFAGEIEVIRYRMRPPTRPGGP